MTIPDAVELIETIIMAASDCNIMDEEVEALELLVSTGKKTFLLQNGWREVPGDNGATEWLAPVTFTKPLYFALDAAYALEANGEGIVAYATQELNAELLRAADVDFMQAKEDAYIAETGHPLGEGHGVYPNY
jgi:hypothetical protein